MAPSDSGNSGDAPGFNPTTTDGVIPLCQMTSPDGVRHSSMASKSAEPSESLNSPSTCAGAESSLTYQRRSMRVSQRTGHDFGATGRASVH